MEKMKCYHGDYIKMNQIQVSHDGKYYALAYQDSGRFYVSILDRGLNEKKFIDVSNILKIDEESKPIELFEEPGMTAIFMPDDSLFIQVYHRIRCKNYHFTYDWKRSEPKASAPVIH